MDEYHDQDVFGGGKKYTKVVTTDLPDSLLKDGDTVPGGWLRRRSLLGPAAARRNPLIPGSGSTRVRERKFEDTITRCSCSKS